MMLQNIIKKFENYLVITNVYDAYMICDAFSKLHDA